jgi:Rrf2 family protein
MMNASNCASDLPSVTRVISGTSRYAIRAVVYLAERGKGPLVRVDEIARAIKVPRNYLSKTLHVLAREGVLASTRGPRGGFTLAAPPTALTLARITAPFDGFEERRCLLGRPTCSRDHPCAAHSRWQHVAASLQQFFAETTVADLLAGEDVPDLTDPVTHRVRRRRARPRKRRA